MPRRICVFVDGENFRHAMIDLFPEEFRQNEYLPKSANWQELFDWLVAEAWRGVGEQASLERCERVRTYWYVIQSLDFFPYRFPKQVNEEEREKLKRLLCHHPPFRTELEGLHGDSQVSRMREIVSALRDRQTVMRRRFDGWTQVHHGISTKHRSIEFRAAGAIRYNLFDNSLGPEKAVDVKLGLDLFILRETYDIAVIVSGDQDYVPAVQEVKDTGKRIINVAFRTKKGRLLPGGAWRLNQVTDWSVEVLYEDLKQHLNLDNLPLLPEPPSAPESS